VASVAVSLLRGWRSGSGGRLKLAAAPAAVAFVLVLAPVAGATTITFSYTGALQTFTVPAGVSSITITAEGGDGGTGGSLDNGGRAVIETGTFAVVAGSGLSVLVGGAGGFGVSGGGGGGSFVYTIGAATPMIAAGGGGGAGNGAGITHSPGVDATTSTNGTMGDGNITDGGTGGGGGQSLSSDGSGGGGGGYTGDGQAGAIGDNPNTGGAGGSAVTSGGGGGAGAPNGGVSAGVGGFGGGGGAGFGDSTTCTVPAAANGGGGGGYSGGGGGAMCPLRYSGGGGGGGSFNAGSDQSSALSTYFDGNGQVVITYAVSTTTVLGSSQGSSMAGQSVTFTATVTGASPSGTVNFEAGGVTIGGCGAEVVGGGGTAMCTTSGLPAGGDSITALYSGDTNNETSTSSALTQTVITVPDAPTVGSASGGNGQATVSFTAPASNGGSAITGYTVTASPGGTAATTSGSPITVTGLTNGTAYTFTVTATNSVGTGSASAASNSVTPASVAGAPMGVSATAGDRQATVSFTAPANNGSAITSYTVTASPGGATASGSGSPITVTGLTNGTAYTFTVTAINGLGTGAASSASNTVTPAPAAVAATPPPTPPPTPPAAPDTQAPAAPADLAGRFSGGDLVLSWQTSGDNIGVDHYEVYLNDTPLMRIGPSQTQASIHTIEPTGQSVYTVRAFDAAGNQSAVLASVTVERVKRPKGLPQIPHWAWKLLAWQEHGQPGTRPKTPAPLPHWYPAWESWRQHPFQLGS
jgi:hypothetical protein